MGAHSRERKLASYHGTTVTFTITATVTGLSASDQAQVWECRNNEFDVWKVVPDLVLCAFTLWVLRQLDASACLAGAITANPAGTMGSGSAALLPSLSASSTATATSTSSSTRESGRGTGAPSHLRRWCLYDPAPSMT